MNANFNILTIAEKDSAAVSEEKKEDSSFYSQDDCSRSSDQTLQVPAYRNHMDGSSLDGSIQLPSNGNKGNYLRNLLMPKDAGHPHGGNIGSGPLPHGPGHLHSSGNENCGPMIPLSMADNMYHGGRGDGSMSINGASISDKMSTESSSVFSEKMINVCDSDQSSAYAGSGSGNGSNGSNGGSQDGSVYKFKHNITKRFSQEEKRELHPAPSCDTSSSSSKEEETEKVKRKYPRQFPRHKPRGYSIDSLHSITEGGQSYSNHIKYGHGISNVYSHCNEKSDQSSSDVPLPAFVLNPKGTHYIPISIHPSYLGNIFSNSENSDLQTYHPISIPVNFGGPYITMRSINTVPPSPTVDLSHGSAKTPTWNFLTFCRVPNTHLGQFTCSKGEQDAPLVFVLYEHFLCNKTLGQYECCLDTGICIVQHAIYFSFVQA